MRVVKIVNIINPLVWACLVVTSTTFFASFFVFVCFTGSRNRIFVDVHGVFWYYSYEDSNYCIESSGTKVMKTNYYMESSGAKVMKTVTIAWSQAVTIACSLLVLKS